MLKSGSPMPCGEFFRRRWPALEFRGWVRQETLCNRSSVSFDLRPQGGISNCRLSPGCRGIVDDSFQMVQGHGRGIRRLPRE